MATRRRSPRGVGRAASVLLLLLWLAHVPPLAAAPLLPLQVTDNACSYVLDTAGADDQYYLIIGSLARGPGRHRVTIRTEATDAPLDLPLYAPAPDPAWTRRVRELGERLTRARKGQPLLDNFT